MGEQVAGPCHELGQLAQLLRPLAEVQPLPPDAEQRSVHVDGELFRAVVPESG